MTSDSFLTVVWRRKWIVLASTILVPLVVFAYSSTLTKVYETSTSLLIATPSATQSFDAVQASQVAARTYGEILTSPNIAEEVSKSLGGTPSRDTLLSDVSADPVPEPQLLKLTAESNDPQ